MAIVNTGKAFFTEIEIVRDISGAQDTITESVLQAFGSFSEIDEEDIAMLSETAVLERYTAFKTFLNNKYPGMDIDAILTNVPINENPTLCPIIIN
jgi:CMP-N-acetylneuraminic acid synthetase